MAGKAGRSGRKKGVLSWHKNVTARCGHHGEALFGLREPQVVTDQLHEVGRIFAIVNRKGAIQGDIVSVLPKEASADGVEGARPERVGHRSALIPERLCDDTLNSPLHLDSGTSR
jgi:hypothetical protein